jgi:hypothetical protein
MTISNATRESIVEALTCDICTEPFTDPQV